MPPVRVVVTTQEPVAWKYRLVELATGAPERWKVSLDPKKPCSGKRYKMEVIPLYAHPKPLSVPELRSEFERWMVEDEKCLVGSLDPYPRGVERRNWRIWKACHTAMLNEGDK